jgi:hypothetical protein
MYDLSRPVPAELADFFFDPDDRMQMDACITALTRDGMSVAVTAPHAAALEHYGALLIAKLRQLTPTSKVEVYFPASPDDLLARFNQALAHQSLAQAMQGRKNILATQFWVLNNAAALPEHELQLLANLVQNFPGANIRLIVFLDTSRKPNNTLESFGKNILRWNIALPDAERKEFLVSQAKGSAQLKAIRTFLNRLNASDTQRPLQAQTKKTFSNPFKSNSMAKPSRDGAWMKWTGGVVGLLAVSVGMVAWLYPQSFQWGVSKVEPVEQVIPERKTNTAKGKTIEPLKTSKDAEAKPESGKESAKESSNVAADLLDELPNEAAAGQAWIKQLPKGTYLVRHWGLPVFKNVQSYQQANPKLAEAHIVATYKPGEKLAQFVLVSGPYKTRAEAMEMTRQAQIPRWSYPVTTEVLTERLTPRPTNANDKPKEARR